ncbi:MAG: hypothetical protein HZB56_21425 [Deltaproteobacteria bacterium]|nr:hypothetical protein [Deltaproteobacteria bacterium]
MKGIWLAAALAAGVGSVAQAQQAGTGPGATPRLLPDISAIGSGVLVWNRDDVEALSPRSGPSGPAGKVTPVFQELEVALQAVVDPFARADVYLTFGPEGAGVEEAYVTTLALPGGLQIKAGTLHSPWGRLNQQHPHAWDFVDAPLAASRLVAAEALGGPGLDVAWLAPLPWFAELHLAYQETTPLEGEPGRRTLVGRLAQFTDLAEGATLGVGLSAARLDEPGAGAWRDLYGADLYLKLRPATSRSYLALQAELYARRLSGTGDPAVDGTRLGGYAQAVYRIGRDWAVGGRWETAPSLADGRPGPEQRFTALASWYTSEFMRLRLQGSYDRLPGGKAGLEALLALEFSIGVHGAHPF